MDTNIRSFFRTDPQIILALTEVQQDLEIILRVTFEIKRLQKSSLDYKLFRTGFSLLGYIGFCNILCYKTKCFFVVNLFKHGYCLTLFVQVLFERGNGAI